MKNTDGKVSAQERILNAGYELLAQKGYANVCTRDIAESAGVALSQLSYYYKTKEKLFISVIDQVIKKVLNELSEVFSKAGSRQECFVKLVDYFETLLLNRRGMMIVIIDFTTQAMWVDTLKSHVKALFYDLNIMIQKYILRESPLQLEYKGIEMSVVAEVIIFSFIGSALNTVIGDDNAVRVKSESLADMLFNEDIPISKVI